jgi:hypothetical protein
VTSATCDICGKTFEDPNDRRAGQYGSAEQRLRVHKMNMKDAAHTEAGAENEVVVPDAVIDRASPSPYEALVTNETRPGVPPTPTSEAPRSKLWQRIRGKKPAVGADPGGHPRERSPRRLGGIPGRRLPAADFLGSAYGGFGQLIGSRSPYQATSRAITLNAPVAGYMLDDAVKGTAVDRIIVQPGVRAQQRYQQVSGLFEVPILVFFMEQEALKPEEERNLGKLQGLESMLRNAIRRGLPAMAPAIKKKKEDDRKLAEVVAELYPDLPEGADPADAVLASIFGWSFEPEPQGAAV